MEQYNNVWRLFYSVGLLAIAVQQLICADFRPVMVPPSFPSWLPVRLVLTWLFSLFLIAACIAIVWNKNARRAALLIGSVLFLLVVLFHFPYTIGLFSKELAVWSDPLKCLTLSGGAFVVAGSLPAGKAASSSHSFAEGLIPLGKYFLAITMVVFGIEHFVYAGFVNLLVPAWIPAHSFFTYFAGIALIAAGVGIFINVKRRLAALLLGSMIFIWFLILHIPRAIADPHSGNGNEWTSVFEALAFSGIAFLLAGEPANTALPQRNSTSGLRAG